MFVLCAVGRPAFGESRCLVSIDGYPKPPPAFSAPGLDTDLSLHSFGIALDRTPVNNPQKKPITRTLPDWWCDIWQANGWRDGRNFGTPDLMHVQYATGA